MSLNQPGRISLFLFFFCFTFCACKVTHQPIPYEYAFESKSLRSVDMSEAENEYLDFRLAIVDSIAHFRWSGNDRPIVYRNTMSVLSVGFINQENKTISSKFCVDRKGKVVFSELLPETDALIPNGRVRDVLKGISGYRVASDSLAPLIECGKLIIRIKKINSLNG